MDKFVSVRISNGDLERDLESDFSSLVNDDEEEDDVAILILLLLASDVADGATGAIDFGFVDDITVCVVVSISVIAA